MLQKWRLFWDTNGLKIKPKSRSKYLQKPVVKMSPKKAHFAPKKRLKMITNNDFCVHWGFLSMSTASVRFCIPSQAKCPFLVHTVRPKHVFLLFRGFGVSFFQALFWSRFFINFSDIFGPFLPLTILVFWSICWSSLWVYFYLFFNSKKAPRKRPKNSPWGRTTQKAIKGNAQRCLSATQFAHNEAEMPSDGLVRSKTRPRWPQSGLKIVWCC